MGQKVNPHGMRVGINKDWDSTWFPANKKDIAKNILEDAKIRKHINKNYADKAISKVIIERHDVRVVVNIYTGAAGKLIGQKGVGTNKLQEELVKICKTKNVKVEVKEVKNIDTDAVLIAQNVAQQIEKRISWRRAMKKVIQVAMKNGVKGIKVMVGGRLDGADIARSEYYQEGILPLHTLRSDIDYGFAEAATTFGIIGIKVWICNGEILGKKRRETSIERSRREYVKPNTNRDGEKFVKREFSGNYKKPNRVEKVAINAEIKTVTPKPVAEKKEGGNK